MTLKELREIYEGSSTKASDINRKLIFAGIAIVWIFRVTTESGAHIIPENLRTVLLLFCISLCLDVFQYLVRGIMWHIYYYLKREPQADENQTQAEEPEWLNSFPDSFWYAKYVPTIIAYIGLAEHLGITALGDCAFINMLGTWKVVYVVGIIFGVLMLWYVITESLKKNNGEKSNSILCRCIRVTIGILSLICFTLKLFL